MGHMRAAEMRAFLGRDRALDDHLRYNHYPPIHPDFKPVAVEAIDKANEGDWEHEITMPNGITKTVGEIVEGMHLEAFLGDDDE
jgi:hypothetical protein